MEEHVTRLPLEEAEFEPIPAAGRNPAEILIFTMMTVTTAAATSEVARPKLEDYRSYVIEEGALVLMSDWTSLDFSKFGVPGA